MLHLLVCMFLKILYSFRRLCFASGGRDIGKNTIVNCSVNSRLDIRVHCQALDKQPASRVITSPGEVLRAHATEVSAVCGRIVGLCISNFRTTCPTNLKAIHTFV
jgi:hypothetical protein